LGFEEFHGGIVRANQVVRFHRREIEEHNDHAAIADLVSDSVRSSRTGTGRRVIDRNDEGLRVFRVGFLDRFNIRIREAGDFLVFAIVRDDELICSQTFDRLSIAASYFDIDADDVGLSAEDGTRIQLIGPRGRLRLAGSGNSGRLGLLRPQQRRKDATRGQQQCNDCFGDGHRMLRDVCHTEITLKIESDH
jgi:hypothetical protein